MTAWPKVRLGEVLHHRKEFITIDDVQTYKRPRVQLHAQGIVLRDEVPGALIKTKKQQVCRANEFLVAEIDAKVGGFGIVPPDLNGAIVSSHYFLFIPNENRLDYRFLHWFSKTPAFRGQVEAQGSTNYAAIRPADVLGYEVPLPPLVEQRRIVARIEDLAAKIAEAKGLRQQTVGETEALCRSAASAILATLPIAGTLSEVLLDKPRNGWSARCDNADSGTPVLTLSAVTGFHYDAKAFKKTSEPTITSAHYWLKQGDLLITRSNTPELVGHAAIYDGTPSPCIYPDLMMTLPLDRKLVNDRFVWLWLQTANVRAYISSHAKGTSPTMKKISQGIVMAIPFPVRIRISEQHHIVAYLGGLHAKVDALKRLQSDTAAELDALLPAVLDSAFGA